MNTFDIKTVADAAAELARKTSQNMTEASTKAWKDFYAFSDTVAKAQAEALKGMSHGQGYGEFYDTISKFQADAVKNFSGMFGSVGTTSNGK